MQRPIRIGIFVLLLVGVVGGSALAAGGPRDDKGPSILAASAEPEAPPTDAKLKLVVERLEVLEITAEVGQLKTLAATYGLGGAVRLLAWADSTGKTVAELTAMRDAGRGWGDIAHELGTSPGIGWIMGNGNHGSGHGKAGAPGQLKGKDHAAEAEESASKAPGA
ncbi:MAG: hypothetical protein WD116_01025 [Chloroflexota bacterium]